MKASKSVGFSLVELLIVIAVLGIILAVMIPILYPAMNRAKDVAAQSYTHHVVKAVEMERTKSPFTLPPNQSCTALTRGLTTPESVASCSYTPSSATDQYTVTVLSITGKTFTYDGITVVSVP